MMFIDPYSPRYSFLHFRDIRNDGLLVYHLSSQIVILYYTTVRCFVSSISLFKACQRSLLFPRPQPPHHGFPQQAVLWGRDCKGRNLFSFDQICHKKKSFFEDFLCSLLSAFRYLFITALGDPFIQVADAKVITYFILTKYLIIYFSLRSLASRPTLSLKCPMSQLRMQR